jgi:hypothetical protein
MHLADKYCAHELVVAVAEKCASGSERYFGRQGVALQCAGERDRVKGFLLIGNAGAVKPQAEANARTLSGGSATDSSALISFAYCRGSACARRCSCKATSPKRKLPYGDAEKCSVRKVNSRPFIAIGTRSNRVSARCGLYFPETEF